MLDYAARLSPDDGEPPISTTRLLVGAVEAGRSTTRANSYPSALARAIEAESDLARSYQNILGLFNKEPVAEVLARLQNQGFSRNVENILQIATQESSTGLLSDDIVHSLVNYNAGLARSRIDLGRLAASVDSLVTNSPNLILQTSAEEPKVKNGTLTVEYELDSVLATLDIPVIHSARRRLLRAAASRGTDEMRVDHILSAMIEIDPEGLNIPTDATTLLGEAYGQRRLVLSAPAIGTSHDPLNFLTIGATARSFLERALRIQQEIFLNPALGTKGLVAAILTMTFGEKQEALSDGPNIFEDTADRFRDLVRARLPSDEVQRWNRALEREPLNLPKLNSDQPGTGALRDKLGITMDALAIANVAAAKSTSLPLAFGIFGDWGAGKSFFMRLIQEQISGFVKSTAIDDGFEHAIVQIQFNAWHYAETNLWASLVGHIFEELDRWMTRDQASSDAKKARSDTKTADQLLQRLSTSRQLTFEAAVELVQRRKDHDRAGKALAVAQERLATAEQLAAEAPSTIWQTVLSVARAEIEKDDELQKQLSNIKTALALPELSQNKAAYLAALDQLNLATSAGSATLGALRSTIGSRRTIVLGIAALVGIPLVLFILNRLIARLTDFPEWADFGRGFEALVGLLGMLSVLVGDFGKRLQGLANKFAHLKEVVALQISRATEDERNKSQQAVANVAKTAAEVEKAKTLVQATSQQVALALKDYAEETGALRISRFVRARAGTEGYGRHLGLVSTIRKDFEQLESLMLKSGEAPPEHLEEARKHYKARVDALIEDAGGALEPDEADQIRETTKSLRDLEMTQTMQFHRVVLYIDDLDRCDPNKVVEVLQAVNMLLSFQLFVVMVAVDARWLSRSLETQYPQFFGITGTANGAKKQRNSDEDEDIRPDDAGSHKTGVKKQKDTNEKSKKGKPQLDTNAPEGEDGIGKATAADYLEKIFQIPYWVVPMTAATSKALVGDLVAVDRVRDADVVTAQAGQIRRPSNSRTFERPQTPEDEQPRSMVPPPQSLRLTEDEINSLIMLSPYLGGSPRRARRFVNVYRVAKASLTPDEVKKLEDGEHLALATQLAIATGAPNAFRRWVHLCNNGDERSLKEGIQQLNASDEERRNIENAFAEFCRVSVQNTGALKRLAHQSVRAGRFSFAMPHKVRTSSPLPQ
ncbi:KAP family P-loop domain-containing protein [Rhodospirillales bacterium URHD0017]|nr:KAP family P-loop domain-containing protein [Rhodospirillales bacterium URHD0017]